MHAQGGKVTHSQWTPQLQQQWDALLQDASQMAVSKCYMWQQEET